MSTGTAASSCRHLGGWEFKYAIISDFVMVTSLGHNIKIKNKIAIAHMHMTQTFTDFIWTLYILQLLLAFLLNLFH